MPHSDRKDGGSTRTASESDPCRKRFDRSVAIRRNRKSQGLGERELRIGSEDAHLPHRTRPEVFPSLTLEYRLRIEQLAIPGFERFISAGSQHHFAEAHCNLAHIIASC